MEHFERNDPRRQALPLASIRQQRLPPLAVMEEDAGVLAAGIAVGRERGFQSRADVGHLGIRIGHRARRTYRGAAAAARAQVRFDAYVIAVGADGAARAHVDARVAAFLPAARMRADLRVVGEKPRLLEFADQADELLRGERLLERIVAGREIALRQLVHAQERLARKIEDEIKRFFSRSIGSGEVDGADLAASLHALAVILALRQVDLIVEADRLLRAGAQASIAARANLEIDRVLLAPLHLERAEPAFHRDRFS